MSTNNNSSNSSGGWHTWTVTTTGTSIGNWITFYPTPVPAEAAPEKNKNKDGCDCKKCKEFFPYAEPNQDDGTLICYKCRIGW